MYTRLKNLMKRLTLKSLSKQPSFQTENVWDIPKFTKFQIQMFKII